MRDFGENFWIFLVSECFEICCRSCLSQGLGFFWIRLNFFFCFRLFLVGRFAKVPSRPRYGFFAVSANQTRDNWRSRGWGRLGIWIWTGQRRSLWIKAFISVLRIDGLAPQRGFLIGMYNLVPDCALFENRICDAVRFLLRGVLGTDCVDFRA